MSYTRNIVKAVYRYIFVALFDFIATPISYTKFYYKATSEWIGPQKTKLIIAAQISIGLIAGLASNLIAQALTEPIGNLDKAFTNLKASGEADRAAGNQINLQLYQGLIFAGLKFFAVDPLITPLKKFFQKSVSIYLKNSLQKSIYSEWLREDRQILMTLSDKHGKTLKGTMIRTFEVAFNGSEVISEFFSPMISSLISVYRLWKTSSNIAIPLLPILVPDLLTTSIALITFEVFMVYQISRRQEIAQEKMRISNLDGKDIYDEIVSHHQPFASMNQTSLFRSRLAENQRRTTSNEIIFEVGNLAREYTLNLSNQFITMAKYSVVAFGIYRGSISLSNVGLLVYDLQQVSLFFKWWSNCSLKISSVRSHLTDWNNFANDIKALSKRKKFVEFSSTESGKVIARVEDFRVYEQGSVARNRLNLEIKEQQHWVVYADSGAGKTLFLQALAGFVPNNFECTGKIVYSRKEDSVVMIPQKISFPSGISLGAILANDMCLDQPLVSKTVELINHLKVFKKNISAEELMDKTKQWCFSGGQTKKLAVIRLCLPYELGRKDRRSVSLVITDELLVALDNDKDNLEHSLGLCINQLRNTFPNASTASIDHYRRENYTKWHQYQRKNHRACQEPLYTHQLDLETARFSEIHSEADIGESPSSPFPQPSSPLGGSAVGEIYSFESYRAPYQKRLALGGGMRRNGSGSLLKQ